MLVLTRKVMESIDIGDSSVTVVAIRGDRVRLSIDAPKGVKVNRREVTLRIQGSAQQNNGDGETSPPGTDE